MEMSIRAIDCYSFVSCFSDMTCYSQPCQPLPALFCHSHTVPEHVSLVQNSPELLEPEQPELAKTSCGSQCRGSAEQCQLTAEHEVFFLRLPGPVEGKYSQLVLLCLAQPEACELLPRDAEALAPASSCQPPSPIVFSLEIFLGLTQVTSKAHPRFCLCCRFDSVTSSTAGAAL